VSLSSIKDIQSGETIVVGKGYTHLWTQFGFVKTLNKALPFPSDIEMQILL